MTRETTPELSSDGLVRGLGRWDAVLLTVGAVIGTGIFITPADVARALESEPGVRAVYMQASETSTGVAHPVREVAGIVRAHENTALVVDAISAVGVMDLRTDEWGLDVVVGGSQKAWQLSPGLAFASVSPKAWELIEKCAQPRFYFDWLKERKSIGKHTTTYTPAVSLILGLRKVLAEIREEGLDSLFSRAALYAEMFRAAMRAIGLELFAPDSPSDSITAVRSPEGIDAVEIVRHLSRKYHITIAGGQDQIKNSVFRVSHMGHLDGLDMVTAVAAVEMTLKDLGCPVELGRGVRAAQEILARA